ncbi:antibiotic biosynthesis monooxygenase family protein [Jiella pacifica]|uniref:Antibiotic biosynthesis monooxygenase n=1 Tax=Jiella pacifica TaxID=2696469 RepID=A0A6N9TC88_9HYPH|nr:antibiotic biosynthesis monooxygenase [Jiella pacifica]NDW06498.1 antibiotic biosynthesis monooxygenase [Jiella pacifica]
MYIAMNRFRVVPESTEAFEELWRTRKSHLDQMPGFIEFHMLKGEDKNDHVLYASHTVWESRETFEAWTRSEAFRASHANAGRGGPRLYLGHPEFEGFEVIQRIPA